MELFQGSFVSSSCFFAEKEIFLWSRSLQDRIEELPSIGRTFVFQQTPSRTTFVKVGPPSPPVL